jgi:hypothetical protein
MRPTLLFLSQSSSAWKHMTVEWSPKVASIQLELPANAISHFILPDLPCTQKAKDCQQFLAFVPKKQCIQTLATCWHTPTSLGQWRLPANKILLVGGNDKGSTIPNMATLSVVKAAQVLQNKTNTPLWGVANPKDPNSLDCVKEEVQAGTLSRNHFFLPTGWTFWKAIQQTMIAC